jgi:hypothetical protein
MELLVAWKNGTESWVRLATLKDSFPVELAEFAKARGIEEKCSAVKARFQKKIHKFGIELPTSIRVDENNLWMEALEKKMFNIGIAFEVLEDGASAPKGWNKVIGHIIWGVKMDFERKARWVLDGHKQADPEGGT